MSFIYRLAGDALQDPRQLDLWLQEEVLDEIEALCIRPPSQGVDLETIHGLRRVREQIVHYVVLRLLWSTADRTLIVLGIRNAQLAGGD